MPAPEMSDTTRTELEAATFRRLVEHLRERSDVQNIDLMNLADFCRNCLSRWYREAFPDCIAYGFFPQRHQSLYETWPLIHGADERIDVRDLGFAASFFHELPRRLLA